MAGMSAQALIIRRFSFIALSAGAASCISLIGGMGLEAVQEKLLPLVPLLIALPALNTMVGDYAAIIAAHAGDPAENKASKKVLAHAIAKAIWVNVVGVLALSIAIAWQRGYIFSSEFILKFIVFAVFSMVSVIAVMFLITSALDKALESRKLNADDVLIPIVTSITDVFMLLLVAAAAWTIF
jgi:cation transporter-like permease